MIPTLLLMLACSDDGLTPTDSGVTNPDDSGTTASGDTGESETEDSGDDTGDTTDTEPPAVEWRFADVFGVPNIDDDNRNRKSDYSDNGGVSGVSGEDDYATFTIPKTIVDGLPDGESVRLTLSGDTGSVRIFKNTGQILGQNSATTAELSPTGAVSLSVEFATGLALAYLELERVSSAGMSMDSAEVVLMSSPLLMGHHLMEAEEVWVVAVDYFGSDNDAMIADFHAELGSGFTEVNGRDYSYDVWIQDEFEWGNYFGTDTRIGVVLDLIRDRGIDDYAEDEMVVPGRVAITYGSGNPSSQDYGGNLETSPPVTVGGTDYPFGRFYYGDSGRFLSPHEDMVAAIEDNVLQAPFTQDIQFLCVGHVDEYSSFIPDPTSAKGFKLVVADVDAGYALLESMNSNMQLPQFKSKGFNKVSDILNDNAIRALNEDLRDDYIEPNIDIFKAELGLTEADIIRFPGLFEEIRGCGGTTAALWPGTVNLTVANFPGEPIKLIVPDPFLRSNTADQSSDALIQEWERLMPPSVESVFVDDWDVYHMALGEVHCGSKVQRVPDEDWWDTSLDLLLEGN